MEIYKFDRWLAEVKNSAGKAVDLAKYTLTDNKFYDAECAYSPDGKWICFTSMRSNDGDIYIMRADGSHLVQITDAPGYDGGPFFSPDGKRLVYRSDRQKNNLLQIFVADLAFDEEGNITGKSAERQLTHDVNVNWCPYWHPDGRHLIYASSREGHANYELFAMRDDGTHDVRITFTPGPDILPVFSPDGKYLMWTCKRSADNTTQIFAAAFHAPAEW
jgi:Tol biopolymer transport system component